MIKNSFKISGSGQGFYITTNIESSVSCAIANICLKFHQKSIHNFSSCFARRQADRQTDAPSKHIRLDVEVKRASFTSFTVNRCTAKPHNTPRDMIYCSKESRQAMNILIMFHNYNNNLCLLRLVVELIFHYLWS